MEMWDITKSQLGQVNREPGKRVARRALPQPAKPLRNRAFENEISFLDSTLLTQAGLFTRTAESWYPMY